MKKILSFIMIAILGFLAISCSNGVKESNSSTPSTGTGDQGSTETTGNKEELVPSNEDVGFAIHYDTTTKVDGKYYYNLWLWEKNKDGADYQFNEEDEYGLVARYKFSEFSDTAINNSIGFIIKENKVWADSPAKDTEADRYMDFSSLVRDEFGYYNIYLKNGDGTIYTSAKGDVNEKIETFSIVYNTVKGYRLWFKVNKEISGYKITQGDKVIADVKDGVSSLSITHTLGAELPDLLANYTLEVTFDATGKKLTAVADSSVLYGTKDFEDQYAYDGELGAIYSPQQTIFRVWSPISSSIKLRIYQTGTPANIAGGSNKCAEYKMVKKEKGVWEYTLPGDNQGKYYTYVVTNSVYSDMEVVDPYAKSTGVNGVRGMIVDFSKTNPEGWDSVNVHNYQSTGLTVYETHVSDLTSSSTWNGTKANAKLFKGFYEEGTSYTEGSVTVKTGFDHIKELGVNAVQLLPIFDQANNEKNVVFNWGYNPLNYNVLEGAYSSNPEDGYTRIKEFKELVAAYNAAGINIIMDVVYNHVNGLKESNFDVLMPKYYFRYTGDTPLNGSGCGNETASERIMYRKFMIDSTEFWAKEYKLGGFRFDLMAIHDVNTMNQLADNLHKNVNEAITVYGEPWAAGSVNINGEVSANQNAMNQYEGYGCFNDKIRDALIKGGLSSNTEKGWATNDKSVSSGDLASIKAGITGQILVGNSKHETSKCVNYVTCHDNFTLYDRIKAAGITDEETIKKMAMTANSIVFTSQGISFMNAGEEFLRTKDGNHNSYNASYKVNELNYALKIKNIDTFENYKKLIALKQNTNLFGLDGNEAKSIIINTNTDGSLIYYDLVDSQANRHYRIIHSNGVNSAKSVNLEGYTLYLDTLNSNVKLSSTTTIAPYQTIIAYK